MATWQDGPEYAPAERPNAFAAPDAARPLEQAPARSTPAADIPAASDGRPPQFAEPEQVEPLERYHPDPGPRRDPEEPYAVARSAMTEADSAWGAVHDYHVQPADQPWAPPTVPPVAAPSGPDPRAPIVVAGGRTNAALPGVAPEPGAPPPEPALPGASAPPAVSATQPEWLPQQRVAGTPQIRFGEVFDGVTVPTFLTLLIGGTAMVVPFFGWLSPLMFLLAFGTSTQILYRRHWVRNTFLVAAGALGTTIGAGLLMNPVDILAFFDLVYAVSTAICWLVLVALFVIVWQSLANGEEADPPASRRSSGWG